jgi:hypothetical protein
LVLWPVSDSFGGSLYLKKSLILFEMSSTLGVVEPHQRAHSPQLTAGLAREYKNLFKSPYGRIPPKAGLQPAAGFFKLYKTGNQSG